MGPATNYPSQCCHGGDGHRDRVRYYCSIRYRAFRRVFLFLCHAAQPSRRTAVIQKGYEGGRTDQTLIRTSCVVLCEIDMQLDG